MITLVRFTEVQSIVFCCAISCVSNKIMRHACRQHERNGLKNSFDREVSPAQGVLLFTFPIIKNAPNPNVVKLEKSSFLDESSSYRIYIANKRKREGAFHTSHTTSPKCPGHLLYGVMAL